MAPSAEALRAEDRGGARWLVLARPASHNRLDADLRGALRQSLAAAARDGVRVVVVSSAPADPPAFSAGAELGEIGALSALAAHGFAREGQALMRSIEDYPGMVVGAAAGPCRGGGLDLFLACDARWCSTSASFAHPGARLGIVTGWGGTRRLPQVAAAPVARRMLASAEALDARDAERAGLVDRVFDEAIFVAETTRIASAWASRLAGWTPCEIRLLKAAAAQAPAGRGALAGAVPSLFVSR